MVFQNHRCKILKNGNSITINVEVNGVYGSTAELYPLLGASVTPSSVWKVSSDCSRVMLDGNMYLTLDGNTWMSTTHPSGFTLDTTDANLTYALSTDRRQSLETDPGRSRSILRPSRSFPRRQSDLHSRRCHWTSKNYNNQCLVYGFCRYRFNSTEMYQLFFP